MSEITEHESVEREMQLETIGELRERARSLAIPDWNILPREQLVKALRAHRMRSLPHS